MKNLTELQKKVLLIIREENGNPIIGKAIANSVDLKRPAIMKGANLRAVINALRTKGWPICGAEEGYYYPQNREDLSKYINRLNGRIGKIEEARDGLMKAFDKVGPMEYNIYNVKDSQGNIFKTIKEPKENDIN